MYTIDTKIGRDSMKSGDGLVAQLVEQLTLNQLVVGSSPTGSILH